MRLPDFSYLSPGSIEEVSLFLRDHGKESKVMGGGTDLLPSMKQRICAPKYLIHLESIPELNRVEFDEESGLRIGAATRLRSLEKEPVILERYPVIAQAAGEIGSVQLRGMGTVGGNLCLDTRCYYYNQSDFWRKCRPKCTKMGGDTCNAIGGGKRCFAVFSGDLAPVLIALGAWINVVSTRGKRRLPLKDLYTGNGAEPLSLEPEEIIVHVEVPPIPKEGFASYLKYRIRKSIDFPLASVACVLVLDRKQGICREARVVTGAVSTKPEEITGIGELLKGKRIGDALVEEASELALRASKPVANAASSPAYRRKMIKALVKKTLTEGVRQSC